MAGQALEAVAERGPRRGRRRGRAPGPRRGPDGHAPLGTEPRLVGDPGRRRDRRAAPRAPRSRRQRGEPRRAGGALAGRGARPRELHRRLRRGRRRRRHLHRRRALPRRARVRRASSATSRSTRTGRPASAARPGASRRSSARRRSPAGRGSSSAPAVARYSVTKELVRRAEKGDAEGAREPRGGRAPPRPRARLGREHVRRRRRRARRLLRPARAMARRRRGAPRSRERVLSSAWSGCEVRASEFGEGAAVRGAAALTLMSVLAEPWLVAERPGARHERVS